MALPARPDIVNLNGQPTYRSLEDVDQRYFDELSTDLSRRKFVEMIHRLRAANDPALRGGESIVSEWRRSGRFPKHLRARPVAPQAIAPLVAQAAPPSPVQRAPPLVQATSLPPGSPLVELSPRFASNYDAEDFPLSPTRGQVRYVQEQLNAPWQFASVAYQKGSGEEEAVSKSIYRFVRPNDGIIEEQLAVKCLEESELGYDEVSREVQMNRLIARTRCSHLVKCKGTGSRRLTRIVNGTRSTQSTAFIYQDFADHNNLEKLIQDHEKKSKKINEHYIWYTLHELTEALSALHDGRCPRSCEQQDEVSHSAGYQELSFEPWIPILHLDIKSDNVMLLKENAEYPSYPKPVLGDFSLSYTNDHDFQNRLTLLDGPRFGGTTGWQPPERDSESLIGYGDNLRFNPDYAPHQWPVTEKVDIWGIGKIAQDMIFAHEPDLRKDTMSKGAWSKLQRDTQESYLLDWNQKLSDCCSQELYDLVQRMLRHNPALRPDLDALRTAIYLGLRKHDLAHSSEVRRKRKRDIAEHLQVFPSLESDGPTKFDTGQPYSPTRKRVKIEINGAAQTEYSQLIASWNNATWNPTQEAQLTVVGGIDEYLVQMQGYDLSQAGEWTAKHLVSCLRKRLGPDASNIYVLRNSELTDLEINDAMSVSGKLHILDHFDEDFWPTISSSPQDAINVLWHAVQWARWLLHNCLVDGEPAEPTGASLTNKSDIHQGIYDWLFIKPSGARYKN